MNRSPHPARAQSLVEYSLLLFTIFVIVVFFSLTIGGIIYDQMTSGINNISF